MYYKQNQDLQIFLVHPGGPFFKNKDEGIWTIPKGLPDEGEDQLSAAIREFEEETGISVEADTFIPLGSVVQRGGKAVFCWAFEADTNEAIEIKSNYFDLEWPPKSGRMQQFPEMDKGAFFKPDEAKIKINPAQAAFIERLEEYLKE